MIVHVGVLAMAVMEDIELDHLFAVAVVAVTIVGVVEVFVAAVLGRVPAVLAMIIIIATHFG